MKEESHLYGNDYRFDQLRRARQQAVDAEMRVDELSAAIKENSVVLCHLIAVTKDETTRDLLQSVHDSLTDAL